MGVILAKFRREKTTYQLLERLEEKILNIEEFSISTQERQKRFVGNFLIISIGLYVITFVVFYFLFFPPTWLQRIAYTTPLLMFPIVILLLKRLFAWYYQRKLNKNASQLSVLRTEKKKIIERVMDTETYKVAIDILNRFGDSSTSSTNRLNPGGNVHTFDGHRPHTRVHHTHHHSHPSSNHHDHFPTRTPPSHTQIPLPTATPYRSLASSNSSLTPRPPLARHILTPGGPKTPAKPSPFQASTITTTQPSPQQQPNVPTPYNGNQPQQLVQRLQTPASAYRAQQQQMQLHQQQYPQTPFPIINYNSKGYLEKLVDFLIGDGISSRYGMICTQCLQHNGMATLEEYEYSAFRCAFCKTLNPARKLRPISPKIAIADEEPQQTSGSNVDSQQQSDTSSGSDSEETVDLGSKMLTKATPTTDSDTAEAEKTTGEKKND